MEEIVNGNDGQKPTLKPKKSKKHRTFKKKDYESNDGMLTTVWGPGMWHFLHTMSFKKCSTVISCSVCNTFCRASTAAKTCTKTIKRFRCTCVT
jgi:hypothetical protein